MATQCVPLNEITHLFIYELPTLYACDIWPVPHVLTVFSVGLYTRSALYAFLFSGIWEIVEALILLIFGNFSLFFVGPADNLALENLSQSIIDDWLIHGGIGALLSWVFYYGFNFPILVNFKEFWTDVYRFWFYVFSFVLVNSGFYFLYGTEVGDGFRLGVLISFFIQGFFILITVWLQPRMTWANYTRQEQIEFWLLPYILSVALNISNLFNWFFSGAIQVWLLTGIYFLSILFLISYRTRWWRLLYIDFKTV